MGLEVKQVYVYPCQVPHFYAITTNVAITTNFSEALVVHQATICNFFVSKGGIIDF